MAVDIRRRAAQARAKIPASSPASGNYLDDIKLPGMAYMRHPAQPVRARQDPARSTPRGAAGMPGVVAVFTGEDIHVTTRCPAPGRPAARAALQNNLNTPRVARDRRRQVDRRGRGGGHRRDARAGPRRARADRVDYEPLPVVVDAEKATQPGAPQLHENAPNNVVFDVDPSATRTGTEAALDGAEVVVSQRIVNQRLIPNPMETRGAIGRYDPGTDEYTLWMTSQTPHVMRLLMTGVRAGHPGAQDPLHLARCRRRLRLARSSVPRVAARRCAPPRSSAAGRSSGSRPAARTTRPPPTAATTSPTSRSPATATATITGLRVKTCANLGGRLSTIGPRHPDHALRPHAVGPYKIPNVCCEVIGVYTNTAFVDAYRGAGRPEATYVVERAMDLFADEIGIDPAEVRRAQLPAAGRLPVRTRRALRHRRREADIDSGDYEPALDRALEMAGYADLAEQQGRGQAAAASSSASASRTLHRGVRRRAIEVDRRRRRGLGRRDVGVGQHQGPPHRQGRGHRGHPAARARATRRPSPRSSPTSSASRSTTSSSSTRTRRARRSATAPTASRSAPSAARRRVKAAEKIKEKATRLAAHMLEARADDIAFEDGKLLRARARPTRSRRSRRSPFAHDLGFDLPEGMEPFLDETAYYDPPNCTWPVRHAHRHRRGRRGDRARRAVRYVAVDDVRQDDQPADRRRPDPRRHRPGHRPGAVGGRRLRRRRPAADGLDDRLRHAEGLVVPTLRARRDGHAVAGQPAGRQGRRRGRHHRRARRRWSTRSSTRCRRLGIRHLDMPLTSRRSGAPCTAPRKVESA